MATTLHERILYLEARVAMAEDRLDIIRSQVRLFVKSLIGWGELLLFYVFLRVTVLVCEKWSKK